MNEVRIVSRSFELEHYTFPSRFNIISFSRGDDNGEEVKHQEERDNGGVRTKVSCNRFQTSWR